MLYSSADRITEIKERHKMLRTTLLAILCIAPTCSATPISSGIKSWRLYQETFHKTYQLHEEEARKKIFFKNLEIIEKHNELFDLHKVSFKMGVNQFTDMTLNEYNKMMNGVMNPNESGTGSTFLYDKDEDLPSTVDWRQKGLVTGVKNQGQCGSCWAFAAVASIEGQHKLQTGKLVSLSEQNLVDCSRPQGNYGCEGGFEEHAYMYVIKNKGIASEKSYPYTAQDDCCQYNKSENAAIVTGYMGLTKGSEGALKNAVATVGPVAVAIDAGSLEFMQYSSGILNVTDCSTTNLNHGVTVIGYGTESGRDYWLVKNSWGTTWGMQGYVKMTRNKNNQCGIATRASYPLV